MSISHKWAEQKTVTEQTKASAHKEDSHLFSKHIQNHHYQDRVNSNCQQPDNPQAQGLASNKLSQCGHLRLQDHPHRTIKSQLRFSSLIKMLLLILQFRIALKTSSMNWRFRQLRWSPETTNKTQLRELKKKLQWKSMMSQYQLESRRNNDLNHRWKLLGLRKFQNLTFKWKFITITNKSLKKSERKSTSNLNHTWLNWSMAFSNRWQTCNLIWSGSLCSKKARSKTTFKR